MAMLLGCRLDCFGVVFSPFEYGIMKLFALPHVKQPPRPPNWTRINSIVNKLHEAKDKKMDHERRISHNDKCNILLSTLGNNSILKLQTEADLQDELKQCCWMAGASTMLDETKANVLRSMIENTCKLGGDGTADVIFDTGASRSLTPCK